VPGNGWITIVFCIVECQMGRTSDKSSLWHIDLLHNNETVLDIVTIKLETVHTDALTLYKVVPYIPPPCRAQLSL